MFTIGQIEREWYVYKVYTSLGIDINPRWQQIGFKQEYFQIKTNIMKTVKIGNNGDNYPMYQRITPTENFGLITIDLITENDKTVEVGDKIEKGNNLWVVKEVSETRPAKGNHPYPVTFQSVIVQ